MRRQVPAIQSTFQPALRNAGFPGWHFAGRYIGSGGRRRNDRLPQVRGVWTLFRLKRISKNGLHGRGDGRGGFELSLARHRRPCFVRRTTIYLQFQYLKSWQKAQRNPFCFGKNNTTTSKTKWTELIKAKKYAQIRLSGCKSDKGSIAWMRRILQRNGSPLLAITTYRKSSRYFFYLLFFVSPNSRPADARR